MALVPGDQSLPLAGVMDLGAYVKRVNVTSTPVPRQIFAGDLASDLICIIDSVQCPSHKLFEYIQDQSLPCISVRSLEDLETCDIFPDTKTFVLLRDFTIELLDKDKHSKVLQRIVTFAQRKNVTVVLGIQSDILAHSSCEAVLFIVDTCITTLPTESYSEIRFSVTHRLAGGKARTEVCLLRDGDILRLDEQERSLASSQPLPTSTFNLDINDEQMTAKSNVVLPHLRVQMEQLTITQQQQQAEGRRILAGDYDDEDPDDDLDM